LYSDTPPTSPTSKQTEAQENNTYESLRSPNSNPVDLNVYAAVGSPNVKPTIDQYEPLDTPALYTYAMVDTPVKAALTDNDKTHSDAGTPRDRTEPEFKVGSLTDNAAYGSNAGLKMSQEFLPGSLSDNTAYISSQSGSDNVANGSHDMEEVNNPMYGSSEMYSPNRSNWPLDLF